MDIINRNIKIIFWLTILLQLVFLIGLIGYKQYAILAGEKIVLKVAPVDPRSLFQGDYARLNYEINRLDLSKIEVEGEKNFRGGEKVYVELEKGDKYFSPKKVSREKPKTKYFIRGITQNFSGNSLQVMYGIETYFMPEGKARDFENVARSRDSTEILIGVSVDKFGQGLIDKIIINGQEIDASDFKEVLVTSQNMRELSVQISQRDNRRYEDLRKISEAMQKCYASTQCGGGVNKYLTSEKMPEKIDIDGDPDILSLIPLDPSSNSYNWVNNIGSDYGYCVYAFSEANLRYLTVSSRREEGGASYKDSEPKSLEDCGVEKLQTNQSTQSVGTPAYSFQSSTSIASIEGYVFIDTNKNKIFDKNIDILYSNLIVRLIDEKILKEKSNLYPAIVSTTQLKNGYYKIDVPRTGEMKIDIDTIPGSGVGGIEPSGTCSWVNNKFPDFFNGGEKVKDCNFIVYFD